MMVSEICGPIGDWSEIEIRAPRGPIDLGDGRELIMQSWAPVVSIDNAVTVTITGILARKVPAE